MCDTVVATLHVFSTVTFVQLGGNQLTSVEGLDKLVSLTDLDVSVLAYVRYCLPCIYSQLRRVYSWAPTS